MLADSSQHYESESANDAKAASSLYLAAISSLNWYESVWRNGSVLDFGLRGSGIETQLGLMERVLFFFCFCFAPSKVTVCTLQRVHCKHVACSRNCLLLPLQPLHARLAQGRGKGKDEKRHVLACCIEPAQAKGEPLYETTVECVPTAPPTRWDNLYTAPVLCTP